MRTKSSLRPQICPAQGQAHSSLRKSSLNKQAEVTFKFRGLEWVQEVSGWCGEWAQENGSSARTAGEQVVPPALDVSEPPATPR